MAEDTDTKMAFAWAGRGTKRLASIEDTIANFIGLDGQGLADQWPEAKERLAEEIGRHPTATIFSYEYRSELIHKDGNRVPIHITVIVLRGNGNGDAPLVVGVARTCDACPILRQIETLCRNLDEAGRRLALRLIGALAAA
jgi:hypothetical protein